MLLLLLCLKTTHAALYDAICTVPVANLFHPALHEQYPDATENQIEWLYQNFPLSTVNNSDCLRIHQLLLHEVVSVLAEIGNEACVQIHNVFYHNSLLSGKEYTFWVLKSAITPIANITNLDMIPAPLNYKNPASFYPNEKTIFTLIEPYYDQELHQTYSVRTRFTILEVNKNKVTVARFNPANKSFEPFSLEKKYGVINENLTHAKKIENMLNLLVQWATTEKPFPSARGGCSAKEHVDPDNYFIDQFELPNGKTIEIYERPECEPVFAGFDSIGLIMSACQIYHIPFCAKNTKTAGRYLPLFNTDFDTLEAGDLVLAKGYAGIIIDPKNHLIVEARGHTYHDGTIRLVPFAKTFKNARSTAELLEKYKDKTPLIFLDKQQKGMISTPFIIVKLNTLFDQPTWQRPMNFLF